MTNSFPKLAVLVSGNGSNLQSIIDHIQSGKLKAQIAVVISNEPNAYALQRAHQAGIPTTVILHQMYESRKSFDQALLDLLVKLEVEWVILAGFMRILESEFLRHYHQKILNIHPSLLPKYPGLHAIEKVFVKGEKETGVTVHYVNEGTDTGAIILQEKIPIFPDDSLETLKKRIHQVEHQLYPKAIQIVLNEK